MLFYFKLVNSTCNISFLPTENAIEMILNFLVVYSDSLLTTEADAAEHPTIQSILKRDLTDLVTSFQSIFHFRFNKWL